MTDEEFVAGIIKDIQESEARWFRITHDFIMNSPDHFIGLSVRFNSSAGSRKE